MASPSLRKPATASEKITLQVGGVLAVGACLIFLSPLFFPSRSSRQNNPRRHDTLIQAVSGPDDPARVEAAIKAVGWMKSESDFEGQRHENDRGFSQKSLVQIAAEKGNPKIVAYLLENNYTETNNGIVQALLVAVGQKDGTILHYIVGKRFVKGDGIAQGLTTAVLSGQVEAASYLLSQGGDVIAPLPNPLIVQAAAQGNTRMVNLLLDRGASVNAIVHRAGFPPRKEFASDPTAKPGVQMADASGRFLFRQQVDSSSNGVTPLMAATIFGAKLDLIRALLSRGADPNIRTAGGLTALDFARHYNRAEIVHLLESSHKPN